MRLRPHETLRLLLLGRERSRRSARSWRRSLGGRSFLLGRRRRWRYSSSSLDEYSSSERSLRLLDGFLRSLRDFFLLPSPSSVGFGPWSLGPPEDFFRAFLFARDVFWLCWRCSCLLTAFARTSSPSTSIAFCNSSLAASIFFLAKRSSSLASTFRRSSFSFVSARTL